MAGLEFKYFVLILERESLDSYLLEGERTFQIPYSKPSLSQFINFKFFF